jgi:nuclease-like protein
VYGPFGRGVTVGSLGTALAGFLAWIVAEESGAIRAKHGAIGEQNTAKELARLQRDGWHVRNDIHFDRFNVDHVLIGTGGVFAVETKTTSGQWDFTASRLDPLAADAIRQARGGARKVRLLLSSTGTLPVRPVLVCWGPDIIDLPAGWRIVDEVLVIVGRQAHKALPAALAGDGQGLTRSVVDTALKQIDAFIARRDQHDRQQGRMSTDRRAVGASR